MNITEKIEKGSNNIVFVYTICADKAEALSLGYSAILNKLAISMDYWNIDSIYPWQGVIQEVSQLILMFSTEKYLSSKLMKHIESEHSYNIPMVICSDTNIANIPYSLWVTNTLKSEDKYFLNSF